MSQTSAYPLTREEKLHFVQALSSHLPALRARAGLSQAELSHLVGISRQTYSSIEGGRKTMSWETYLALLFFFDYHQKTHSALRSMSVFPSALIDLFNGGAGTPVRERAPIGILRNKQLLKQLDDHALHALQTLFLIEYARCTGQSGSAVLRAFDGREFSPESLP